MRHRAAGAADIFGAFHVEALHVLLGQHQILRTSLAEHLQPALLGEANLLHRFAVGNVDDHDGNVDQLGKRNRTVGGLALDRDRARRAMEMRRGLAGSFQAVGEEADGIEVFRVHHHQRAGLARHRHHFQDLAIAEREVLIGHEYLERGVAVLDQRRQFLAEHLLGRIGDDEMEANVDAAIAVGLGVIVAHRLAPALSAFLQAERQHHGVAAEGGSARAAFEIIGHHDAGAIRLRDMDMAVDAAWQHQAIGGIDNLPCGAEIKPEGSDPSGRDPDVAPEGVGGCRHGAAANDGVERHVAFSVESAGFACPQIV